MEMEDFDRIKVIGKGSYGEVWLSKHKKDKKQYVLKRINLQRASKRERTSAEQEAKLLQKLRHPNIVAYKQSFETADGMLYIAMQYCEGGDLYTRLKEQKGELLEERQVVEWFVQIAMALQYMHERNILHRDLKTQNIFLTKSKIIKVGDLGIARVLEGATDMATTLIGTPYYMSPELFSNKPYNHKSDVWALGCCVYEMTTLKHAFNAKDMNSLVYKILKGKLPPMPRQYGPELRSMMRGMLHQDPEKRPSVNRLLRDPYIKRNIARFLEETQRTVGARSGQPASAASKRPTSARANQLSPSSVEVSPVSKPNSGSGNGGTGGGGGSGGDGGESSKPPKSPARPSSSHSGAEEAGRVMEILPKPGSSSISGGSSDPSGAPAVLQRGPTVDFKDEPDSSTPMPAAKNVHISSSGDAPVAVAAFKPSHARRPSNLAPKELEPIEEDGVVARDNAMTASAGTESDSEKDTVKAATVKEVTEPQGTEEGRKRKKKKKLLPSRPAFSSPTAGEKETPVFNAQSAKSNISSPPKSDRPLSARPLPMPKVEVSQGLPQKREPLRQQRMERAEEKESESTSSKSSSDGTIEETPRSLKSARERRREASKSIENPLSARNIKLRQVPTRASSQKVTKKEKVEAVKVSALTANRQRQRSEQDSSSSDESTVTPGENTQEREKRRENKEMNNFISVLDNTLKMNSIKDGSDEELKEVSVGCSPTRLPPPPNSGPADQAPLPSRKHSLDMKRSSVEHRSESPPEEEPAAIIYKSTSMPSVQTLASTSRLMDRIRLLHKDCVKSLGYVVIKQAFDILDKIEEDEVEPKLMDLLGKEKFDEYAGKIWQLKFCQESLFMAS